MRSQYTYLQKSCLLGFLLILCVCFGKAQGWRTIWGSNKQPADIVADGDGRPSRAELPGRAVLELARGSEAAEEEGLSRTFLMKQAHSKALSSPEASCWQKAYRKLLSSCSLILQDEEKKCRLAFEFTDCFLRMTGWPPPPPCPDNGLVRFCTEKFDQHTHEIYLAFFVETAAMCHHLQSEAFRKETSDVVNDLKQTGHWVLDKVKEVEGLSQDILNDALEQSKRLEEKLTGVQTLSQTLLTQNQHFDTQLKSTLGTVQAVYDISDHIKTRQKELQELHHDMNQAIHTGVQDLEKAALQTHQQLHGISEGNKQLSQQQVQLASSLADNIQRLKDSALQSLDELKDSQTSAMEETRESLKGLHDGAQKAQASFETWRTEMDDTNELLLKGSHAMLNAQEAFVEKQGSILSTLDRMFSLYDNILYESRALKLVLFYGTSLVFVHVLTCAKQTNNARAHLYSGLCMSMAMELYLMKAYGSVLQNQQWIETRSYWIRAVFGVFTTTVIFYFIATYRDLSLQNHELLLKMHKKLSNIANQSRSAPYYLDDGHSSADTHEEDQYTGSLFLRFSATASSLSQMLASKILRRVHKFIRRRRGRKQGVKKPNTDAFRAWMEGHGLDTSTLQQSDDSSEEDDDPDYQYSNHPYEDMALHSDYNLRSSCSQSSMCRLNPTNTRRFRY